MEVLAGRLGDDPWRAIVTRRAGRHGSWAVGGVGELLVGALLDRVPSGWYVTHDVDLGPGGDVDSVLVGPGGVVTVHSEVHGRKPVLVAGRSVSVAGRPVLHVPEAEREAARVGAALSTATGGLVRALGLVVVVGDDFAVRQPQTSETVRVVHAAQVLRLLAGLPRRMSACEVRRCTVAVRDPATWLA